MLVSYHVEYNDEYKVDAGCGDGGDDGSVGTNQVLGLCQRAVFV